MTIGQRIAEKRRERGLSQEALGEALGVTRQSISKWEGDGSLPEIEKLVAMSRLFGVSVGWLLGEETEEQREAAELSEQQVRLVGEIVSHYLSAQERTAGRRRRWLGWLVGGAAAVCLTVCLVGLARQMDRVEEQGRSLGEAVGSVADGVERMTAPVNDQYEFYPGRMVKGENEITADFDVRWWGSVAEGCSISYDAYAIPKAYEEGMEAIFVIDSGSGPIETEGTLVAGRKFEARMVCERTDNIRIYVVFRRNGAEERQLLCQIVDAFTDWAPDALMRGGGVMWLELEGEKLTVGGDELRVFFKEDSRVQVEKVWAGLFKNRELVAWYTPISTEEGKNKDPDAQNDLVFHLDRQTLDFAEGDTICCALVVLSDSNSNKPTCTIRYEKVYDYNTIAGIPAERGTMTAEWGYRQNAPLWLWPDQLTDEEMEAVPGHEVPVFKENSSLSTSG